MKQTFIRNAQWSAAFVLLSLSSVLKAEPEVGVLATRETNPYWVRTFEINGRIIDEVVVPGSPPPATKVQSVEVPEPQLTAGINSINNVPAFSWCYGCSATSAAMLMGYYDNQGYPNMYTGPANGGVCPMNNDAYWGHEESPLSATHIGKDGRTTRGHVEDYWIANDNPGPDPYIVNGWTEHIQGDCTADFMGTSQSKYGTRDGWTFFYYGNNNTPLYDYTGGEPSKRDGCHGMKLFANSRGYTVSANFSQYIYGYNGIAAGFSYSDFKAEIDAGRPVLIHLEGHTVLGYGYNDTGNIIYIHDTWDNNDHSMSWGGSYSSMKHYAVSVLRLENAQTSALQFKSATYSIAENGASVRVYVSRTGGSSGAASVNYTTANGTAAAGSDYTSKSGTLNWAGGDAADKYVDISITDDSAAENAETFTVVLSSPGGAILGSPSTTTVTIAGPNDQPPAPANDLFVNAMLLSANSGTINSNNSLATTETGEPAHAGNGPNKSIWYKFTPAANGTLAIDTHGSSFDTILAIYTGAAVGSLTPFASNDQDGSANNNSGLSGVALIGGTTYRIAIASFGTSAAGTTVLNWSFIPTVTYTVTFDAQGGTTPSPTSKSVVYGSTYGTLATTTRAGYTFSGWWTGTGGTGIEVTSSTVVTITSAQTLYAKWNVVSAITLSAALDNSDLPWARGGSSDWFGQSTTSHDGVDAAQSGVLTHSQTNWIYTTLTGPGVLWYWWKVSSEETYDRMVFVYDGQVQDGYISGTTNNWSQQGWNIPAGSHACIWAYVKDASESDGSDCGWVDQVTWTPTVLPSVTLSMGGSMMAEAGGACTVTATLSAASVNAVNVNLSFSGTASSAVDYTRSATSIVILAGNMSGTIMLNSIQDTEEEREETIVVSIDSVVNGTENGAQQLTATIVDDDTAVPPANDNLVNATIFSASSGTMNGDNSLATTESGEPAHAGFGPYNSIWYKFTPTASGTISMNTHGSSFDTVLAIYTGSAVGSLTVIASNDDDGSVNNNSGTNAFLTGGTTYRIAIAGYGGTSFGSTVLNWTFAPASTAPANDHFANALLLSANSGTINSNNNGATAESGEPAHAGLGPFQSVWYKFTPATSGTLLIDTHGSAFDTVLAIYTGSAVQSLSTIVANDDDASSNYNSGTNAVLTGGVTYRIAVAGYGDYSIGSTVLNWNFTPASIFPSVTLSCGGETMTEAGGTCTVTAKLSAATAQAVTVNLSFSGSAAPSADYIRSATSIVIAAGTTSGSLLLTPAQDEIVENNETIIVDISLVLNGTESGTQQVMAIIIDDDSLPCYYGAIQPAGGKLIICWPSLTNHHYSIHCSTNLMTGFSLLQSNIAATPALNSYTDSVITLPQKYWRVTIDP